MGTNWYENLRAIEDSAFRYGDVRGVKGSEAGVKIVGSDLMCYEMNLLEIDLSMRDCCCDWLAQRPGKVR